MSRSTALFYYVLVKITGTSQVVFSKPLLRNFLEEVVRSFSIIFGTALDHIVFHWGRGWQNYAMFFTWGQCPLQVSAWISYFCVDFSLLAQEECFHSARKSVSRLHISYVVWDIIPDLCVDLRKTFFESSSRSYTISEQQNTIYLINIKF